MAGESHRLRIGWDGGTPELVLCSDCAALDKTIAWALARTGDNPALHERLLALQAEVAPAIEAVARGEAPDVSHIARELAELGDAHQIGCLSCITDAGAAVAGEMPRFAEALDFVGRTLDDLKGDAAFNAVYAEYHKASGPYLARKQGVTGDWPKLQLVDGKVTWHGSQARLTAGGQTLSMAGTVADVLAALRAASQSTRQYLDAAQAQLGIDPLAVAKRALGDAVGNGELSVDVAKTRLKHALIEDVLTALTANASDPASSVAGLNRLIRSLNNADQGNLAELWVIRHRQVYDGADPSRYVRQPQLQQGDNPAMSGTRKPDFGQVEAAAGGQMLLDEVKSGRLGSGDVAQLADLIEATREGNAVVRSGGKTFTASEVRLTMTDLSAAQASVSDLQKLLWEPHFTLEVFDRAGKTVSISRESQDRLQLLYGADDLASLLGAL